MADQYKTREERRAKAKQSTSKKKPEQKRKGVFKKLLLSLFILGLLMLGTGVAVFAMYVKDAPELDSVLLIDPVASDVLDMNGDLYTTLGTDNRDYVEYEDIPKEVEDAVLATEDVRFHKHGGIDFKRLAGAVIANVTRGFGSEGASTLTQQVVKLSFLNDEKSLKRKAQEAWLAIKLEQKYTKEQIFEIYINKIFYANGVHGIETASKYYFGKELDELALQERAFLAGVPQRPNAYDPYANPDLADKRKNIVLSLMHQHKKISKEEMEAAKAISITETLVPEEQNETNTTKYNSIVDQVIREVESMGNYNVFADGLTIYTTIDPDAQEYTDQMLLTDEVVQFPDDQMQAGIVLMDTKTGEIRAIGGNRNKEVKRGRNYATQLTERSPGSTIKPILDYGPAIEYLKWSTYEQIVDEPYSYSNGVSINNFDRRHLGQMSIREALYRSRNIPALKAFQEVGNDKANQFAANIGLPFDTLTESASIGSVTNVSPMNLAAAYAAFGNNGVYNKPHTIKKIVLRDGETEVKNKVEPQVAMKDSTAYMVTDMLKDVMSGKQGATGKSAIIPGLPAAGKTGTTNFTDDEMKKHNFQRGDVPDSWFAGYTTNYSIGVWTGYETRKNAISTRDQKIAQLLYKNLMQHVSAKVDTPDFKMPGSVVRVPVEKGTNPAKKPSAYTPESNIVYELFLAGTEPKQVSDAFDVLNPPSVSGEFRQAENEVAFSWSHPEQEEKEIEYDVSISANGEKQALGTMSDTEFVIQDVQPGVTYVVEVTAVTDSQRSNPGTASVTVPEMIDDDELEEDREDDEEGENPPTEENPNPDVDNPDQGGQPDGEGGEEGNQNPDNGSDGNQNEQPGQGSNQNPDNNGNSNQGNNQS